MVVVFDEDQVSRDVQFPGRFNESPSCFCLMQQGAVPGHFEKLEDIVGQTDAVVSFSLVQKEPDTYFALVDVMKRPDNVCKSDPGCLLNEFILCDSARIEFTARIQERA